MTGATSGLGRAAAESIAAAGRARLHRRARPGADRTRPQRDLRRGRLRGRGRPRRSLVTRGDRRLRGPLRDEARPPRRARPERRCAHPRIHGHGRGERDDVRDARPVAVPPDPCAAASARGVGTVARDRGRVRRHVHRTARRRRPRPRPRRATTGRRHTRAASAHKSCWPRSGRETCSAPASPSTRCIQAGPTLPGFGPRFPASAASWGRSSERRSRAPTRSSGWPPRRTPRTSSGLFFLDRRARAKHRLRRTRRPDEAREAARLWRLCTERTAPFTAGTGGSAA